MSPGPEKGADGFNKQNKISGNIPVIDIMQRTRYILVNKIYIIHTSSSVRRLLFFSILKCVGVSPVIFLNWFDRWATLL